MTPHRNDVLMVYRLFKAGKLAIPDLWLLDIRHEPVCPMRNPRNLVCSCQPQVWVEGRKVAA